MNPDSKPSLILFVIFAAFFALRMYARVRRLLLRQQFSKRRSWFSLIFFPALASLLFILILVQPRAELADAAKLAELSELGGAIIGVALGIVGLRKTKYESTPEGLFYTPNAHIGIALSVLVVARIGYRYYQMFTGDSSAPSLNSFVTSPLTLLFFGTLVGYYATYAFGLLRWSRTATVEVANASRA